MTEFDVIIIGAGAAGLMCAIEAGQRGRHVLVLDHANKAGKKILMSGGGRCNFTNLHVRPENFISHNPHFCKSALSRFTPYDFIKRVEAHGIAYHEKTLGQLFCNNKSKDIVALLLNDCEKNQVTLKLNTCVNTLKKGGDNRYQVNCDLGELTCESLVIATGGLSIPTLGATPFGYKVAAQFDISVWPTRAGLVPLTLHETDKLKLSPLAGVSADSTVSSSTQSFKEAILFTHRGLSGPAILQISSYWQAGGSLTIDLLPEIDLENLLLSQQQQQEKILLKTFLSGYLPKRLVMTFLREDEMDLTLKQLTQQQIISLVSRFKTWTIKPNGTEGYRVAEVTLGGVDCNALSSKTFEVTKHPRLYFIGEVLDVTGWLGGYNFQWAWSSGFAAGQYV